MFNTEIDKKMKHSSSNKRNFKNTGYDSKEKKDKVQQIKIEEDNAESEKEFTFLEEKYIYRWCYLIEFIFKNLLPLIICLVALSLAISLIDKMNEIFIILGVNLFLIVGMSSSIFLGTYLNEKVTEHRIKKVENKKRKKP